MPKMKRHKGLAKRIRVSAKGKLRYNKSNAGHLMTGKSGGRCRRLRKKASLADKAMVRRMKRMLQA